MRRKIISWMLVLAMVLPAALVVGGKSEADTIREDGLLETVWGISREEFLTWMESHEHDDYYIGTPFGASYTVGHDARWPNGSKINYGEATTKGMQCTGFVWCALYEAGADGTKIPHLQGSPTYPYKYPWWLNSTGQWKEFRDKYRRTGFIKRYDDVETMLKSHTLNKGDIIFNVTTEGIDSHVGIYWGADGSGEDLWWSSGPQGPASIRNNQAAINAAPHRNDIGPIIFKEAVEKMTYVYHWNPDWTIELTKTSAAVKVTKGNPKYSLKGAVFGVYKDRKCTQKLGTITTDEDGKGSFEGISEERVYVREDEASPGYARLKTVKAVTKDDTDDDSVAKVEIEEAPQADPIPILLQKKDREHESVDDGTYPTAGGTLEGAVFKVVFKEGNRTWRFKSDANGQVRLDRDPTQYFVDGDDLYQVDGVVIFPLGTYTVTEEEAPKGYMKDDQAYTFEVRGKGDVESESGEKIRYIHTVNEDVEMVAPQDQIQRGDIRFDKKTDDQEPLEACPFIAVEKTTGEAHVIVTDPNGIYDSSAYPHTSKTNGNDAAVTWKSDGTRVVDEPERTNDEMVVDEEALDYEAGTWFSKDMNNKASEVKDDYGALPYSGSYQIREIRSAANAGWALISFTVRNVTLKTADSGTADLGTKTDKQIDIRTTASDKNTRTRISYTDIETVIVDRVEYSGLKKGENYVMEGVLHKKEVSGDGTVTDGGVMTDAGGKPVTAKKAFTATGTSGYVSMEFAFNSTGMENTETVVFEKLLEADGRTELAAHEDIGDIDQTVEFEEPKIGTTAKDKATGTSTGMPAAETTIIDTIAYEGLKEGREYLAKGTPHIRKIRDGAVIDGGPLKDESGKELTFEKTFTAAKGGKGTVQVAFTFDSSLLMGEKIVAFEEVSREGCTVAIHADITDEPQTVEYLKPRIGTTLTDKAGKGHTTAPDPEVVLVDKIRYKNLPVGRELTFKGVLMDKRTGRPFKVNGKKVTATRTVTLKKTSGTLDMEFKFSTVDLEGKILVAFESVTAKKPGEDGKTEEEVVIAEHRNIRDVDQTVKVEPVDVKTRAKPKSAGAIIPARDQIIIDTVTCTGLIVGKEYTITGKVYDKSTGKPIDARGSTTFTAKKRNQQVTVTFTVNARDLAGKELVVGEDLYRQDKKIAAHFNLNDAAQTVPVEKTAQTGTPIRTGDARMLLVWIGLAGIAGLSLSAFRKRKVN